MRSVCIRTLGALALGAGFSGMASAAIDLELRPVSPVYSVGQTVELGLYAVSDSGSNQLMAAADVLFGWDITTLDLLGNDNAGATPLLVSAFPPGDIYGLNESNPPQDGNGYYQAFALLGSPVSATPAGTLLTTLEFTALSLTPSTVIELFPLGGVNGRTRVFDGTVPNLEVTGALVNGKVGIVPEPGALLLLGCGALWAFRRR